MTRSPAGGLPRRRVMFVFALDLSRKMSRAGSYRPLVPLPPSGEPGRCRDGLARWPGESFFICQPHSFERGG